MPIRRKGLTCLGAKFHGQNGNTRVHPQEPEEPNHGFAFLSVRELVDIKPDPASHFIHSMSEPFSEEDIEDQIMHNWIDHFKMRFHQLHASGHMKREQLEDLISRIQPKKVFPIHTEHQQLFKERCQNVQTVEYGKEYTL